MNHRIGQSTHLANHWQGSITQRIQLGQTARLEPGRYQQHVGTRNHLMGKGFVIGQAHRHAIRVGSSDGFKSGFKRSVAISLNSKLSAFGQQSRQSRQHQIKPFLWRQPADDTQQWGFWIYRQTQLALQNRLAATFADQRLGRVRRADAAVVLRVPNVGVHAVQNA